MRWKTKKEEEVLDNSQRKSPNHVIAAKSFGDNDEIEEEDEDNFTPLEKIKYFHSSNKITISATERQISTTYNLLV